eukprot:6192147-Pleurochrysis_carterae.AAC.3
MALDNTKTFRMKQVVTKRFVRAYRLYAVVAKELIASDVRAEFNDLQHIYNNMQNHRKYSMINPRKSAASSKLGAAPTTIIITY